MDGEKIKATLQPLVDEGKLESTVVEEIVQGNAKLFARAKTAEESEKLLKEENARLKPAPVQPAAPAPQASPDASDPVDEILALQSKGLNPDEMRYVRSLSKSTKRTLDEVLSDPIISGGLEAARTKKKAEAATPSSTGSPAPGYKPGDKVNVPSFDEWQAQKKSNSAV